MRDGNNDDERRAEMQAMTAELCQRLDASARAARRSPATPIA